MISWIKARRELLIVQVVAALALVLLWAGLRDKWRENQNTDYFTYYAPVAHRLLAGGGFREPGGAPAAFYPPGFSLFLAAAFGTADLTRIPEEIVLNAFILLCTILCVTLVYAIARAVSSKPIALVSGLLWATYPFFLWLEKQPNSETPFMVLFLAGVYALLRVCRASRPSWGWAVLTGVFIGVASLVRPIAVVYVAVCCAGLFLMARQFTVRARMLLALCMVGANVFAILPWELWVYVDDGERILLDRNAGWSVLDGMTFALHPAASGVPLATSPDIRYLMMKAEQDHHLADSVGAMVRFLASESRQHPLAVAHLLLFKAERAWYGTNARWLETWTARIQMIYLAAAAGGLMLLGRRESAAQRGLAVFIVVTVIYFWVMAILVLPLLRYLIPAMSLLMLPIAALAWSIATRHFRWVMRLDGTARAAA